MCTDMGETTWKRQNRASEKGELSDEFKFKGIHNVIFLAMILGSVFINDPPYVREIIFILVAVGSYFSTNRKIYESNHFNFYPIIEVAVLFLEYFQLWCLPLTG